MKIALLVADGMGDWPLEELNNKTPMEVANTPNMDALAKIGIIGLAKTIPDHMDPGSDVANMSLLGFDPAKYHTGRGPIEAAALQVKLNDDDIIFRMNLVTVTEFSENGKMLDYSAGHISKEDGLNVVNLLKKHLDSSDWHIVPGFQYRHLLIKRHGLTDSLKSIKIHPPHDILDQHILNDFLQYKKHKELFDLILEANKLIEKNFPKLKVNSIWPWGQGKKLALPDFYKTYGLKGAVISAVDLVKGLGYASNMSVMNIEGATGLVDTNYKGKAESAIEFLRENDFVFVHLEGPDECAHGGDVQCKITAIERFDKLIVEPIAKFLRENKGICIICCDHLTPISKRTHVKDPVPVLINDFSKPKNNDISIFNEKSAKESGIFFDKGHELLKWILQRV